MQKLPLQKNRRKHWCVWLAPRVQLANHLFTFLVAKDLRINWKSFKISANGDLWNLPTHQIEWKIHSTKCLMKPEHDYHWDCYQRFTNNLDRLNSSTVDSETIQQPRTSVVFEKVILKLTVSSVIKSDERRSKRKVFGQLKLLRCSVWMSMLETAENKKDEKLLRRIRGFDFFVCELSFHSSCRRQYQRSPTHWWSANEENKRG